VLKIDPKFIESPHWLTLRIKQFRKKKWLPALTANPACPGKLAWG